MKSLKKFVTPVLIAAVLSAAAPAPKANAALVFFPLFFWALFLPAHDPLDAMVFVMLDNEGNIKQDALEQELAKRYPAIDSRDTIHDLAVAIRQKADLIPADADGKKTVALSRAELLDAVAATGLDQTNPDLVEKLAIDFQ